MRAMRWILAFICAICLLGFSLIAVVTQPLVTPLPSTPPPVDAARLEAHVRKLSADFYPRSADQRKNLELSADYIVDALKASNAAVSIQEVVIDDIKYRNIIAHFGPAAGPLLVIGAHYDSHGDEARGAHDPRGYTADSHTPGADDNASGVAGLLELARLLAAKPQSRAIELVAYTLEEPPYFRTADMGSAWHARSLRAAHRDVTLMLSLEMIGSFNDVPGGQDYPVPGMASLYSDRGDFIAVVGKLGEFGATRKAKALMAGASDLPVYSINAPPLLQGIDFSDHLSYWNAGYPALMITDTAFLRNHQYHRAGDTWDKLDYRRMAKVVQGVYALSQGF